MTAYQISWDNCDICFETVDKKAFVCVSKEGFVYSSDRKTPLLCKTIEEKDCDEHEEKKTTAVRGKATTPKKGKGKGKAKNEAAKQPLKRKAGQLTKAKLAGMKKDELVELLMNKKKK